MGTKTVVRLLILSLVIALLCGGGYLIWWQQVGRMSRGVLARAEQAEKAGDFAKAAELYREYQTVVPNDVEVALKYAEDLLKADRSTKRLDEALAIFDDVLEHQASRADVRRRAAEVALEMGRLEKARGHLKILHDQAERENQVDGHVEYLLAQCYERDSEFADAEKSYESAIANIEHGNPEWLEASYRRAVLLRDKLGQKDKADKVIDAMVQSAPEDFRAYLGRGRYREGLRDGKGAADDFRKALRLAPPGRSDVYLEVARSAERESGFDAARRVLEEGLAASPKAVELYLALSNLELRAGAGRADQAATNQAAEVLERGLKELPDRLDLRLQLALLLAEHGDTNRLLLRIDELERQGAPRIYAQYLRAYYHINQQKFLRARQILGPLQAEVASIPVLKAKVNVLLSRCYSELSEPELAREAALRGYSANPRDAAARAGWIQELLNRGAIDEVIRLYRGLEADQPGSVRLPLAALLIEQNRRLPEAQRQWTEAEKLIDNAEAAAPKSAEAALLRVELLRTRGEEAKAIVALEAVRDRFPGDVRPWREQARLLIRQKKLDEARGLLDRAGERFGDGVDLRLVRLQLAAAQGGPQAAKALEELTGGLERFSREDRRRLLTAMAAELGRRQDLAGATRAWSRLAEEEPESLGPRLQLFDLALLAKDAKQAEVRLGEIAKLDEQFGRYYRSQYLAWQARTATDAKEKKEKARAEARGLLNELKLSRPDWSQVPLALARLDREELAEVGPDKAPEKLESAITAYRRARELGLRDPAVDRELVQLLFRAGRGSEALEIYGGRMASQAALEQREFRQAEEIARKDVAANPRDLQARLWLARVLIEGSRPADAEEVLREAVAANRADPDRWANLVIFLVQTRQLEKAAKAVDEAQAHIAGAPLIMAQCCENVGKAYGAGDPDQAKSWYGRARQWFDEAQKALNDPADPAFQRRLAEFLIRTDQTGEAERPLREILDRTTDGRSPDLAAWARRRLAEVYALGDPPRIDDGVALLADRAAQPDGDADDLRVLSLVHEAQGTPEGRRQAIDDLKALIGRESATPEDRRRLALLLDAAGEWEQAREQFRELIQRTEDARDIETLARRPMFITLFFDALIRHHHKPGDKPGDAADLAEARQLVERFKSIQFQRNPFTTLVMEAQLDTAAGRPDEAAQRVRQFADRSDLTTAGRLRVAQAAERLGLFDVALAIFRRVADEPPTPNGIPNWAQLAAYLGRRGQVKDAVDLCEAHWADTKKQDDAKKRQEALGMCVGVLSSSDTPLDKEQMQRVINWLNQARQQEPREFAFALWLGGLYDRLGDYRKAEEQYRAAVGLDDRNGVASNNLAWLIALRGGSQSEALSLINRAISAKGANPEFLDTRGVVRLAADQGQLALGDLKNALKGAPSAPKYFHLAEAYLKLNDKSNARRILEAGKSRGLPTGLHELELPDYKKMNSELGRP
jgi:cellulose synthase operon protein C